jgi:hypothetical protein
MPGVSALVSLLSLDVCTALVASGRAIATLAVVAATNASPIIITTATAHGIQPGAPLAHHLVVSGVGGNTAANNLDADGVTNDAWVAVGVDDTSFALYSMNPATGALVASAGNGAYTSGGIVRRALTDGRILLGRQHVYEQSAPPRLVFIPRSSEFGPKAVYSRSNVVGAPSDEQLLQAQQRSIATDKKVFEVHAWGAGQSSDPDEDFDETEVLYQQVCRSVHLCLPGSYSLGGGQWSDQMPTATQMAKDGHEFVFSVALATPILDRALSYAPSDVGAQSTVYLQPADGSPPEGVTIT